MTDGLNQSEVTEDIHTAQTLQSGLGVAGRFSSKEEEIIAPIPAPDQFASHRLRGVLREGTGVASATEVRHLPPLNHS